MATQFKIDELTEAEDRLVRVRTMLVELRAAIQDTEKLIEAAERKRRSRA